MAKEWGYADHNGECQRPPGRGGRGRPRPAPGPSLGPRTAGRLTLIAFIWSGWLCPLQEPVTCPELSASDGEAHPPRAASGGPPLSETGWASSSPL